MADIIILSAPSSSLASHTNFPYAKNYVWLLSTGLLGTQECNYHNAHEYDTWFLTHAKQVFKYTRRSSLSQTHVLPFPRF